MHKQKIRIALLEMKDTAKKLSCGTCHATFMRMPLSPNILDVK